jgi:predicted ATPase with chaperone activity
MTKAAPSPISASRLKARAPHSSASTQPNDKFEPIAPHSIQETELSVSFLADLVLKTLYFEGYVSGYEVSELIRLPFKNITDRILEFLKRERFLEVKGSSGGAYAEAGYEYAITSKGSERAREIMERSQYAGPAPVTLKSYKEAMRKQALQSISISPDQVRMALSHLVLSDKVLDRVGPAVNSSRSIFLFGHPGNGKTTIAEAIGFMILQDEIYIPHAVEVNGQVIKVYDPVTHKIISGEPAAGQFGTLGADSQRLDRRWLRIRRPVIVTGGELTLESLDLAWDNTRKYYEAPLQMKANGGMFLIDDFGRQQVRPRDLLNRWIVPLEKGFDYLTLQTGNVIEIPFDMLIIFATNLEPRDLVDEAFLRRIRHKIDIQDPTYDEYREIFRRVARSKDIEYDEAMLSYVLQEFYVKPNRELRSCHPRDILDQITDIARFRGISSRLSKELIDQACQGYFVDL